MKKIAFRKKNQNTVEHFPDPVMSVLLDISSIAPNPNQPRRSFDEVGLVTLADSIRQHGLLQPITVRYAENDECSEEDYVIIAGERRYRAMKMLGYRDIPCLIVDISAKEAAELAIIENIMRKDLSMFELAEAFQVLLTEFELTQEELGKRLSTSQSNIANKLRLLRFSQKERMLLEEFGLSERHARALIRITDDRLRLKTLIYIGEQNLSVKLTEAYIDRLLIPQNKDIKHTPTLSLYEAASSLQEMLEKPLKRLFKQGVTVESESFEDEDCYKLVLTIPKTTP